MAQRKKRMANMEMLRILAMLMVTMLHYLGKGEVLPELTGDLTLNGYLAWILELLSIVAVDVYMLISGFFLVESGFKTKRLVQLLCQVLFYSLLIPLALMAWGILQPGELTLYRLLQYIFPTQMLHYWFLSAYVMMYLFSPILRIAARSMKKGQLRAVIVLLLLFLSVNKSILPVRLEMDHQGYDGIWFMVVYLIAAYMRLYGMEELEMTRKRGKRFLGKGAGFLGYFLTCGLMFLVTMGVRFLYLRTGQFETFLTAVCGYNHILTLFAAICLFVGFYDCRLKEGCLSRIILKIAPYTLGVYLLHEHIEVRNLWPRWLGASVGGNPGLFVCRCIGSVILVFLIGILVDMARGALFQLAGKLLSGSRVARLLDRVDAVLAGNGTMK